MTWWKKIESTKKQHLRFSWLVVLFSNYVPINMIDKQKFPIILLNNISKCCENLPARKKNTVCEIMLHQKNLVSSFFRLQTWRHLPIPNLASKNYTLIQIFVLFSLSADTWRSWRRNDRLFARGKTDIQDYEARLFALVGLRPVAISARVIVHDERRDHLWWNRDNYRELDRDNYRHGSLQRARGLARLRWRHRPDTRRR